MWLFLLSTLAAWRDKYAYKPQRPFGNGSLGTAIGQMDRPVFLCTLASGDLVVSDSAMHRITVFSNLGEPQYKLGELGDAPGQFHSPAGLAVDGTAIYIVDSNNHRLQKLRLPSGTPIGMTGSYGKAVGQLAFPTGIVLLEGLLYVADTNNHRIVVYDTDLKLRFSFSQRGAAPGKLSFPQGLAAHLMSNAASKISSSPASGNTSITQQSAIYVTDSGNDRVQVFDPRGSFLHAFGGSGTDRCLFDFPLGVTLYTKGEPRLYISEFSGRRVQVFSLEGDCIDTLEYHWMGRMYGLHADNKKVFIADWDLHIVQVLNRVVPHFGLHTTTSSSLLQQIIDEHASSAVSKHSSHAHKGREAGAPTRLAASLSSAAETTRSGTTRSRSANDGTGLKHKGGHHSVAKQSSHVRKGREGAASSSTAASLGSAPETTTRSGTSRSSSADGGTGLKHKGAHHHQRSATGRHVSTPEEAAR